MVGQEIEHDNRGRCGYLRSKGSVFISQRDRRQNELRAGITLAIAGQNFDAARSASDIADFELLRAGEFLVDRLADPHEFNERITEEGMTAAIRAGERDTPMPVAASLMRIESETLDLLHGLSMDRQRLAIVENRSELSVRQERDSHEVKILIHRQSFEVKHILSYLL